MARSKLSAKIVASPGYDGRVMLPSFTESLLVQEGGGVPNLKEEQRLLDIISAGAPEGSLDDVIIRLGMANPGADAARVWRNQRLGPIGTMLGGASSFFASLRPRTKGEEEQSGPYYNPLQNVIVQPWGAPGATAHELGHAIDFNSRKIPQNAILRRLAGTMRDLYAYSGFIPGATLWKEHVAWRRATQSYLDGAAKLGVPPEEVRKFLKSVVHTKSPALGTYWGGSLGAGAGALAGGALQYFLARKLGLRGLGPMTIRFALAGAGLGAPVGVLSGVLGGVAVRNFFSDKSLDRHMATYTDKLKEHGHGSSGDSSQRKIYHELVSELERAHGGPARKKQSARLKAGRRQKHGNVYMINANGYGQPSPYFPPQVSPTQQPQLDPDILLALQEIRRTRQLLEGEEDKRQSSSGFMGSVLPWLGGAALGAGGLALLPYLYDSFNQTEPNTGGSDSSPTGVSQRISAVPRRLIESFRSSRPASPGPQSVARGAPVDPVTRIPYGHETRQPVSPGSGKGESPVMRMAEPVSSTEIRNRVAMDFFNNPETIPEGLDLAELSPGLYSAQDKAIAALGSSDAGLRSKGEKFMRAFRDKGYSTYLANPSATNLANGPNWWQRMVGSGAPNTEQDIELAVAMNFLNNPETIPAGLDPVELSPGLISAREQAMAGVGSHVPERNRVAEKFLEFMRRKGY